MDTDADIRRSARSGLALFFVYLLLYGGFVALPVGWPGVLGRRPFGGVNLAVWYGMALIIAPLVLAAVYLARTRRSAP